MAPAGKTTKRSDSDKTSPSKTRDWGQYSHLPPSQSQLSKNGRQKGRNLITWNRPRMYEKLLLHIQYECARQKVNIPWDHIAHRLNPGSSGNAISQQLGRLRTTLVTEGHLVPPPLLKPGAPKQDPKIRGFARKFRDGSDDMTTTEPVGWNEPFEDLRRNLPDAADFLDEEDHSFATAMTADDNIDDDDFQDGLEDARTDFDTRTFVKSGGAKAKGKMPIKRRISAASFGDSNKKAKTSARPPRAAAAKGISYVEVDGYVSDFGENNQEAGNDTGVVIDDTEDVSKVSSAVEPGPFRVATPAVSPLSTASLPDPFTAGSGKQPGVLSDVAMSLKSIAALQQQQQQQMQPSPVGSPVQPRLFPTHQHGGLAKTPSRMAPFRMTVVTSPNGQAWTVPAFHLGNSPIKMTGTPKRPAPLATTNSSPGNFDFEHATPRTAAAMRRHLDEWNTPEVPSMFTDVATFEKELQRSVERKKRYV